MQAPMTVLAVNPAAGIVRQPGDKVIALRLVAVPPAALDALRPGKEREVRFEQAARLLQQPQRPRPRLPELARIPFAGLDPAPGMLGPMLGLRGEAADRLAAEADAQALDQPRPVFLFAGQIAEQA